MSTAVSPPTGITDVERRRISFSPTVKGPSNFVSTATRLDFWRLEYTCIARYRNRVMGTGSGNNLKHTVWHALHTVISDSQRFDGSTKEDTLRDQDSMVREQE